MKLLTIILCSILFIEQNFINLLFLSQSMVSTVSCDIEDRAWTQSQDVV